MKYTKKGPLTNRLTELRKQNRLTPEQVAILLGFETPERVVDYERGTKTPNLKTALKMGAIYNVPVRVMLNGYYTACRDEIKKEELRAIAKTRKASPIELGPHSADFCTYESGLGKDPVSSRLVAKARRHATDLIRTTAEKLGHI